MTTQPYDYYWYKEPVSEIHKSVFAYIAKLDNEQGYRQQDNVRHMRLYGNVEFTGSLAYNFVRTEQSYNNQNRVTLNIVQNMIDTVVSKITKNRTKPYFLTSGGDFTQQRRAEKLTEFVQGLFYATKFYDLAARGFKDGCIFGTGAVKIYKQDGEIKAERVFIDEIIVDDKETLYGEPRQMHQKKWIHKDVLKQMFPKKAGAIDAACSAHFSDGVDTFRLKNQDMLLVIESWHLRSGKKAKDGKHAITVHNETLYEAPYNKDYFPFVFYKWNEKPLGFFGQGIAEMLTGLQLEINKILRTIQISMHLVSVPKIFVEASSKVVTAHLNNKIGGIIKYAGTPPQEGKLGSVPAELFTHLNALYSRAYEIVGISQLSAQSQKPAGLDSGKALRTYSDIESERFYETSKRYEQTFLTAAHIMVDLAKEIAEETGNYEVKVPGSTFLSKINWADVSLDEDQYVMQVYPTNALSDNPSARLAEVQELLQAGFISKEDGKDLLNFPDLKAFTAMDNAGVEDIKKQIEAMVETGVYQAPEPYQNLQYGILKMQQAYLHYRSMNAPEETLELFRMWMADADELIKQASAALQPPVDPLMAAGMDPNQPIAAPEAQPVSDLLPVV